MVGHAGRDRAHGVLVRRRPSLVAFEDKLAAQNQQLGETAASLSSALAIRNTAITHYHLIVSSDVQFVTVHAVHAGTQASH